MFKDIQQFREKAESEGGLYRFIFEHGVVPSELEGTPLESLISSLEILINAVDDFEYDLSQLGYYDVEEIE